MAAAASSHAMHIGVDMRQRPMARPTTAFLAQHHPPGTYKNSEVFATSSGSGELAGWIQAQDDYAKRRILANIAPFADDPSAMAGAVCASPSRSKPNYYYTWTRDSGLVMNEIFTWLTTARNATWAKQLRETIDDYVAFTSHVQSLEGLKYGLGEAKFNMDGSPFTGSWCNAQTDGPAIRVYMMTRFARYLLDRGEGVHYLYGAESSPIKRDLEYVAGVWHENRHCDIWEESRGLHFYTLMAQRRALVDGARLADLLGDTAGVQKYRRAARGVERDLARFWNPKRNYLLATIDKSGGIQSKHSNLDSQVLLSSLHAGLDDGFFSVESSEMMATVLATLRTFEPLYAINNVMSTDISGATVPIGIAVGRYPEDVYNGVGTSRGNPWSLVTSGLAEYHYRLASAYSNARQVQVTPELVELVQWSSRYHARSPYLAVVLQRLLPGEVLDAGAPELHGLAHYLLSVGDLYMARVARHTSADHTMYEQWYSYDGYGRGAIHLTWSYAAHTAASRARSELTSSLYK
ncbi:Six-hairpin glycosidase [Martensiomyces pterosporus]|nr:Six-hairpin glycosidase [Martensiomyces pterosporus]